MHQRKRIAGFLLAVLMLASALPAAGARQFQTRTVTDRNSSDISVMLDALADQSYTSADAAAVRGYIEYFLYDSRYAAIGGSAYPYTNAQGYWAGKTVTDGVYTKTVSATGCFSYSKFVALVIYGTEGSSRYLPESAGHCTGEGLKTFLQTYAQAGEHLRIDSKHSVTYISGTEDGFYYMDYTGDQNPYIGLRFATYSNFAARCNELSRKVWLYDSDPSVNAGRQEEAELEGISSSEWFYDSAMTAEQLGLVESGDAAAYNSSLTLAETATLCARIHSLLTVGGEEFAAAAGEAWYMPYVTYLEENEVITEDLDWTAETTRGQFISLMFAAVPEEMDLGRLNPAAVFLDELEITDYIAVDAFWRAGIVTGVPDEDGVYFHPGQLITRAEAVTIIARLVEPGLRIGS